MLHISNYLVFRTDECKVEVWDHEFRLKDFLGYSLNFNYNFEIICGSWGGDWHPLDFEALTSFFNTHKDRILELRRKVCRKNVQEAEENITWALDAIQESQGLITEYKTAIENWREIGELDGLEGHEEA